MCTSGLHVGYEITLFITTPRHAEAWRGAGGRCTPPHHKWAYNLHTCTYMVAPYRTFMAAGQLDNVYEGNSHVKTFDHITQSGVG